MMSKTLFAGMRTEHCKSEKLNSCIATEEQALSILGDKPLEFEE